MGHNLLQNQPNHVYSGKHVTSSCQNKPTQCLNDGCSDISQRLMKTSESLFFLSSLSLVKKKNCNGIASQTTQLKEVSIFYLH